MDFRQNRGGEGFATAVNSLLMRIEKFLTTMSLTTKTLFRPDSDIVATFLGNY